MRIHDRREQLRRLDIYTQFGPSDATLDVDPGACRAY
jgi:hypothetical protein